MKNLLIFLLAVAVGGGLAYFAFQPDSFGSGEGYLASACDVNTVTAATIGDDISSEILAAHSRRSYASIQQVDNATNTPYLSFDEGAAATLNNGLRLASTSEIVFGLNTDFPYTGAVTGITNTGSSTLLVTECRY